MGKLVVTEFVSLDGVMQAPGGEDFKYPGWTFEFDRGEDGNQFKLDETLETDALLVGRVTYESFAGAWPSRDGPFADKFNSMPKYVVSSTLADPEWHNTTVLTGDAVDEAKKLKDSIDRSLTDEQVASYVNKLQTDIGTTINQAAFAQVTGANQ